MPRPYTDRKNSIIGKRIDVDQYPKSPYQCVDLIKLYCRDMFGIPYTKTGDADEIWNNKYLFFDKSWTRIVGTNDLMQGDILIRANKTSFHIAIFDHYGLDGKVYVLEQNGSGKNSGNGLGDNAIRVHGYEPYFWTGIYRCPKIIANWEKEMAFIKAKRIRLEKQGKSLDQNTIEYAESTVHKN